MANNRNTNNMHIAIYKKIVEVTLPWEDIRQNALQRVVVLRLRNISVMAQERGLRYQLIESKLMQESQIQGIALIRLSIESK